MSIASLDPRENLPDADIVTILAMQLFDGRQDPSDEDDAIRYLLDLDLFRPSVVSKHLQAAMNECGQLYIARDISRRVA